MKDRAATSPGSVSTVPVLGPPLGKYLILTDGCLLYGQTVAEMNQMALEELRVPFSASLPEHQAHPNVHLPSLVPPPGQAAPKGASPAALQVTHLRFMPKSSFPTHKEDCPRFHAFSVTFR